MINSLGHEINMDPIAHQSKEQPKRMTSYALINITEMLDMIESGKIDFVVDSLKTLHSKELRDHVLSEKEMIQSLSRILDDVADQSDELTDKMTRIFWSHVNQSLINHKVL